MLLRVKDLDVRYDTLRVLWGVSLELGKGEVVCLLGPNGAGKSTVVNTVSGLVSASSGEIWFHDERIDHLHTHVRVERGLSHVLERRRVFPYMTVLENLEMGAYGRRASKGMKGRLEMVYSLFPRLAERSRQLANTLSGGEQQMLAIGRGLMSNPDLLMLDEPFLGLAPAIIDDIVQAIDEINRDGVSLLLIDQNVRQALVCSSRGYILEAGRVVLEGRSDTLLEDPRIREVYLGTS
jgi:branched-chain amino acid transport system ATP-binding protein